MQLRLNFSFFINNGREKKKAEQTGHNNQKNQKMKANGTSRNDNEDDKFGYINEISDTFSYNSILDKFLQTQEFINR